MRSILYSQFFETETKKEIYNRIFGDAVYRP